MPMHMFTPSSPHMIVLICIYMSTHMAIYMSSHMYTHMLLHMAAHMAICISIELGLFLFLRDYGCRIELGKALNGDGRRKV